LGIDADLMTLYLDCNATNPTDPRVRTAMLEVLTSVYGNAGSPHEYGERAKQAVNQAREQIGRVVQARRHEVIFTSGATESNNLAILGLAQHGRDTGKRHLVSSQIEHKAVLEPLSVLRRDGFTVTLVPPDAEGRVSAESILRAVREETLLVSLMHVNNETGVLQPVAEVAERLPRRDLLFHVDAAQGFARDVESLRHPRINLISVSGHKVHGPQGIGALIARREQGLLPPLSPLLHGGGQEFGLRPGTLPVHLIVGFGLAAELALNEYQARQAHCLDLRRHVLRWAEVLRGTVHGEARWTMPHVLHLSLPGRSADQLLESLRGMLAVSDGAACTSVCATASHVLAAMGVPEPELSGAIRLSWSYQTGEAELLEQLHQAAHRLQVGVSTAS